MRILTPPLYEITDEPQKSSYAVPNRLLLKHGNPLGKSVVGRNTFHELKLNLRHPLTENLLSCIHMDNEFVGHLHGETKGIIEFNSVRSNKGVVGSTTSRGVSGNSIGVPMSPRLSELDGAKQFTFFAAGVIRSLDSHVGFSTIPYHDVGGSGQPYITCAFNQLGVSVNGRSFYAQSATSNTKAEGTIPVFLFDDLYHTYAAVVDNDASGNVDFYRDSVFIESATFNTTNIGVFFNPTSPKGITLHTENILESLKANDADHVVSMIFKGLLSTNEIESLHNDALQVLESTISDSRLLYNVGGNPTVVTTIPDPRWEMPELLIQIRNLLVM